MARIGAPGHRAKRKQERAANAHRPRANRIEQKLRTVLGQSGQLDIPAAMLRAEGKAEADRAAIDLLNEDAVACNSRRIGTLLRRRAYGRRHG